MFRLQELGSTFISRVSPPLSKEALLRGHYFPKKPRTFEAGGSGSEELLECLQCFISCRHHVSSCRLTTVFTMDCV